MSQQLPSEHIKFYRDHALFHDNAKIVRSGADIPTHNLARFFEAGRFVTENKKDILAVTQAQHRELIPVAPFTQRIADFIKSHHYTLMLNSDFDKAMYECLQPRQTGTEHGIGNSLALKLGDLHWAKEAHSIEIYKGLTMVGAVIFLHRETNGKVTSLASFGKDPKGEDELAAYIATQCALHHNKLSLHDAIRPTHHTRQLGGGLVSLRDHLMFENIAKQNRLVLTPIWYNLPLVEYAKPLING